MRRGPMRRADASPPHDSPYHPSDMEPAVQVPTLPGNQFRLPPALEGLRRLAYNLYWTWHPRAKVLFSRIDATAWARYRNPVAGPARPRAPAGLPGNPPFL